MTASPLRVCHKEDFQVSEDGHPQAINFFEEHSGTHPLMASEANLPPLPPNVFTNIPRVPPSDAVTVLLLDSMNTQLQDQSFVHAQMMKYLKNVPPGTRMAIFALGNHLEFIQGFTDDASLLSAALRDPKLGAGPQSSPLLPSQGDIMASQQLTSLIGQTAAETGSPQAAAALAAMQQFLAEQRAPRTTRVSTLLLEALQTWPDTLPEFPDAKTSSGSPAPFPGDLFKSPTRQYLCRRAEL